MTEPDERLRVLLRDATADLHAPEGLAHTAWGAARDRPRRRLVGVGAAVLAAAVIIAGLVVVRVWDVGADRTAPTADRRSCPADIAARPLPTWARTGFTPPDTPTRYLLGSRGDIVAVFFTTVSEPLPRAGAAVKILWVSRPTVSGDPLVIDARLAGSNRRARRTVQGGPGPSSITLPAAGCWTLALSWSGHHDSVVVPWRPASG